MQTMGKIAAAALAVAAVPAAAAPTTVTVTGTVMNGYDPVGTFGTAGADLAGKAFSAIFTVESKPDSTLTSTATSAYLYGRGAASPVSAALTIGSGTYNFAGSFSGTARASDAAGKGGTDMIYYMAEDTDLSLLPPDNTLFYVFFDSLSNLLSRPDYTAFDTVRPGPADAGQGQARIANYDPATGKFGQSTIANLSIDTIRADVASPVPEPATWAMMVAGFAMAGVALRRRRVDALVRFA